MATITTEGVSHVANLARLEFNEEETKDFTDQLARILDYIGKLNELDTDDVPPTSHIHPLHNITKADVVKTSLPRDAVLANAPEPEEGYFGVPRVIDTA
ncbi:Asp-tRNA(Asn)/Glu-tRNA(Gln) amidotransferase subunit GatC [Candidatus Poribacteria bacterium]|nr:Asp-tRNA(Asn)/Glu-tRNA(Gln) amidotransferase subunit GatC [Candidatus Poribacteria bacterium]